MSMDADQIAAKMWRQTAEARLREATAERDALNEEIERLTALLEESA